MCVLIPHLACHIPRPSSLWGRDKDAVLHTIHIALGLQEWRSEERVRSIGGREDSAIARKIKLEIPVNLFLACKIKLGFLKRERVCMVLACKSESEELREREQ
eukprot:1161831-Pelagomonas_calceolata.AAC.5